MKLQLLNKFSVLLASGDWVQVTAPWVVMVGQSSPVAACGFGTKLSFMV